MSFSNFRNWSIKNKILAACLFCIVFPLTFTAMFSYDRFNKIIAGETAGYSLQILTQIMSNTESNIREIERLSLSPYLNQQVIDILESKLDPKPLRLLKNRDTVMNFIIGIRNIRNDFAGIYIYAEKNENFYWNTQSLDDLQNYKDSEWYGILSSRTKPWVVLGPHIHGSNFPREDIVFSLVRPINSVLHEDTLGYFMLDINFNTIRDLCDNTRIGRHGQFIILDQTNHFIYNGDQSMLGKRADFTFLKSFKNNQHTFVTKEKSIPTFVSYIVSPYTNWRYISLIPLNELTSNTGSIIKYTVILGIISILLAVFISVFLSIVITKPIHRLTGIMKDVEQGDLEVRFHYPYKDEIGFLSTGFNNMILNMKDLIRNVIDFRVKTKEAELEALQSKINPHFLYNTLLSLQMKAIVDQNEDLAHMLELLGRYMRFSISSIKEVITLKEELEYLNYYIQLQQIRFGPKLTFKIAVLDEVLDCQILKLMIQPIVENAIGHGLEKKTGDWLLSLEATLGDNMLRINVIDNGVGMSAPELKRVSDAIFADKPDTVSMGLRNINERLRIIFEDNYQFSIFSTEGEGTRVEMAIPAIWGSELNMFKKM